MNAVELIQRKRDDGRLTQAEIEWLISGYTAGDIPDYQMAALLMAIYLKGLDGDELRAWTDAMVHSGELLDLSKVGVPRIDKHSTGGVGDKVSIPLAPIVAACGVAVPMMSGRGLGHTGGTLDKLDSIPGFTSRLDTDQFTSQLEDLHIVLAGQSSTLAPADKVIYQLRDVTGTVSSIPLIASSIMSKKLVEDLTGLVMDVKVGKGAFMRDEASAVNLAQTIIDIGKRNGVATVAVLTNMDQPLGRAVGNANEIIESLDVLTGGGPDDLREVVYTLGTEMLILAGVAFNADEARAKLETAVHSGHALEKFTQVIGAQGGDVRIVNDRDLLPKAADTVEFKAPKGGYVTECDALDVGVAAVRLGAGRAKIEDDIDHGVGIEVLAKAGDLIEEGEPLARIAYNENARLEQAMPILERAWKISTLPAKARELIVRTLR